MPKKVNADLKTAIGAIVDETGSMFIRTDETISAFNSYFDDIEKIDPTALVTVLEFSDMGTHEERVRFLVKNELVTEIPYLDSKNYRPRGGTPLYDAIGHGIRELEKADADRYLLVILTDGAENSSKDFTRESIVSLMKQKEATGKWTIVYLAAGPESWAAVGTIATNPGHIFRTSGDRGSTIYGVGQFKASTAHYLASTNIATDDFLAGTKEEDNLPEKDPKKKRVTS